MHSYIYNSEKKLLWISKGVEFAVLFNIGYPPPSGAVVSAMIRCAEQKNVQKFGPVKKCIRHSNMDGGKLYGVTMSLSHCFNLIVFRRIFLDVKEYICIIWLSGCTSNH